MTELQKALVKMLASPEFAAIISGELGVLFDQHQVNPFARLIATAAADTLIQAEIGKLVAAAG